jgi:twitching motility protein PilT
MQFSLSLIGIISQILVPRSDNAGRVPVREILINNDAVRNLIARGEIAQIYSILEMSKREGMVLMDDALIDLIERGIITPRAAINHMRDMSRLESMRTGD